VTVVKGRLDSYRKDNNRDGLTGLTASESELSALLVDLFLFRVFSLSTATTFITTIPLHELFKVAIKAPATDSHQPRVNRLEYVDRRVIRGGAEPVAVEHLYFAFLPSCADCLGTVTKPDLNVCQVMLLLFHFNTHHQIITVELLQTQH